MADAGAVKKGLVRRMYDWVLHWSETPYGPWALLILAFMESSFFPIPPDVLLIALALGMPKRSFRFALMCTVGSVFGGMLGYFIGVSFFDLIGQRILEFYGALDKFAEVQKLYNQYGVWMVGIAGFTPIPYKVFTIASGVFRMEFVPFVLVSFFTRAARFFLVAGLIWKFGTTIKNFIDKYFDVLSIAFVIILLLGFAAVKFFF
jgi:membrane protein YqaA with SNARE-associated domain